MQSVDDLVIFAGDMVADGVNLLRVEIFADNGLNVTEALLRKWTEFRMFGSTFVPVSIEAVFTAICEQNGIFCSGGLFVPAGEEVTDYDGSRRVWPEAVRCFYR